MKSQTGRAKALRESYFQRKLITRLKQAGYLCFALSDSFTSGIPDVYCAKDGKSHWYELKVVHQATGPINLESSTKNYGFTKAQKIKLYALRQAGIDAWGIVHLAAHNATVMVAPEQIGIDTTIEDLLKLPKFIIA